MGIVTPDAPDGDTGPQRSATFDLGGSTALVTGAGGNIGRAIAVALARAGADLVLCDHPSAGDSVAATRAACRAAAPAVATVVAAFDVTAPAQVESSLANAAAQVGAPRLVVNNAGYQGRFANTIDYDLDDARRVLDVNVLGVMSVLQMSARLLRDAGRGGSIVNMASMAGVSGAVNMPAYTVSKAAVIGLTKSAAKDLAPYGIRVNSISPGFIGPGAMWETQVAEQARVPSQYYADDPETVASQMIAMVPLRRYGSLDEVADAALYLLSDASSFVNGINLEVSGGSA